MIGRPPPPFVLATLSDAIREQASQEWKDMSEREQRASWLYRWHRSGRRIVRRRERADTQHDHRMRRGVEPLQHGQEIGAVGDDTPRCWSPSFVEEDRAVAVGHDRMLIEVERGGIRVRRQVL